MNEIITANQIPSNMLPLLSQFQSNQLKGLTRQEARVVVLQYLNKNGIDTSKISASKLNREVEAFLQENMKSQKYIVQALITGATIASLGLVNVSNIENRGPISIFSVLAGLAASYGVSLSQNQTKNDSQEGK